MYVLTREKVEGVIVVDYEGRWANRVFNKIFCVKKSYVNFDNNSHEC